MRASVVGVPWPCGNEKLCGSNGTCFPPLVFGLAPTSCEEAGLIRLNRSQIMNAKWLCAASRIRALLQNRELKIFLFDGFPSEWFGNPLAEPPWKLCVVFDVLIEAQHDVHQHETEQQIIET